MSRNRLNNEQNNIMEFISLHIITMKLGYYKKYLLIMPTNIEKKFRLHRIEHEPLSGYFLNILFNAFDENNRYSIKLNNYS